jgi:hypothetical protein
MDLDRDTEGGNVTIIMIEVKNSLAVGHSSRALDWQIASGHVHRQVGILIAVMLILSSKPCY